MMRLIRHVKHKLRRVFAGVLVAALMLTSLPETVFADEAGTGLTQEQAEYEAIMKMLAEEDPEIAKQYPAGLFKFDTLLAEMNEDASQPLKLYIVRHGGTEGEVTVNVKFSDYSAQYGKDYSARLEGADKDINANGESRPLLYILGNGDAKETLTKAYGSYDSMVETLGQEKVDRMEELLHQYQEDKAAEEETTEAAASVSEKSPLYQLNEEVSQYSNGGVDTEGLWDAQQEMDAATANLSWGMMEEVFPGTEADVTFADGEKIKEIAVTPINNDTSDGERIFSVILNDISNPDSNIDSENTASVTLYDDEAAAFSKIYVDGESLPEAINPEMGAFDIKLVREDALYNVATANFYAVTNNNVVLASGKVMFMPGVEEQKIEIDASKTAGASSVSLYFDADTAVGCEVEGNKSIPVESADSDTAIQAEQTSGIQYTVEDSPIGFAGEGTYSGFTISPFDENFMAGPDTAGPQPDGIQNKVHSNGQFWDLSIPKKNYKAKDSRIYMQSKKILPTFNYIKSIDLDWQISDRDASTCNRVLFSTNDNYNLSYTNEDSIDKLGGVWRFAGDYGHAVLSIPNDGSATPTGKISWKQDSNEKKQKIGTMGTRKSDGSIGGGRLKIVAWKTSGGINAPYMNLYGVHINYKQFKFRVEQAEWGALDNQAPGVLHVVARDGRSNSQEEIRYAMEKLSFVDISPNTNYALKGMQIQSKDGEWIDISSEYFDADQMALTLKDTFYLDYKDAFDATATEYSVVKLRPVYNGRPITISLNTDKNGGISCKGKYFEADSGVHMIEAHAGETITIEPYDVKNGYHLSQYEGNKADLYAPNNTRRIDFQQNQEKQTLKLELYNYVITPVYTESGTNVKINVTGIIPEGCHAPDVTEFSLGKGNLKSMGQVLSFNAGVAEGCRAVWKVHTRDHEWQNRTFYGEYFDYRVINGDNEIELSFEEMKYISSYNEKKMGIWISETEKYKGSFTAINGQVLGYSGTILNPPVSNGHGGYTGEANPVAGAVVSMGNFSTTTDKDGKFCLYEREEDADGDGINEKYYINAYANEDHTIRVTCNNMTQIYIINTGEFPTEKKEQRGKFSKHITKEWTKTLYSEDCAKPYECSLTKGITTDFYGNGPTPKEFYVLTGANSSSAPSMRNRMAAVPMSNTTIGFEMKLDNITKDTPVSRVDFKVYDRDMNLREDGVYSVVPDENGICRLTECMLYEDGVPIGSAYFNGLLNFRDGDMIFVDLIRTQYDAEGNPIDISYGQYNSGVVFYEVPGQGMETSVPDLNVNASSVPELPMIGSVSPGFTAGPLAIKAVITGNSMEFSVGFNVATFTKVLDTKKITEKAKANASKEEVEKIEKLEEDLDSGEITPEEYLEKVEDLEDAVLDDVDPSKPSKPSNGNSSDSDDGDISDSDDWDITDPDNGGMADSDDWEITEPEDWDMTDSEDWDMTDSEDWDMTDSEDWDMTDSDDWEMTEPGNSKPSTPDDGSSSDFDTGSSDESTDTGNLSGGKPLEMKEPTAQDMADPSKFSRQQFGDGFQKNIKDFDNLIKNIKNSDNKSKAIKDAGTRTNGTFPVMINVTVGVTVRMVINPQVKTWVFDSAVVYAQFSLTVMTTFYFNVPVLPIPIYVGFSFTASMGLYNTLKANYTVPLSQMTGEDGEFDPDAAYQYSGMIPFTLSIEIFVGAGIRKLLSLELGGGFIQQLNFGFGDGTVDVKGTGMSSFYGYLEVNLVIFNTRWKFAQKTWNYTLYDSSHTGKTVASALGETVDEAMNAELSEMTINEKQYEGNFVGGGRMVRSTLEQEHTDTILEDVPNTQSQIVSLGDNRAFMVYEGIDNNRDSYNRNAVFYTLYDGSSWSEPKLLQDDGTLDMGLSVEDMGDKIVISWSSAQTKYEKQDFTDGTHINEDGNETVNTDSLLKLLSSMDIYSAVLDKDDISDETLHSAINRITKDSEKEGGTTWGFAHENPNAVQLEDGRIMLFYTSCDYNTYEGDEAIDSLKDLLSAPGIMMYRIFENGAWSEEYYSTESAYQSESMKNQWYGQRVADINLKDTEGNIYYPITGYADITTVKRGDDEKVLITYVIDTDRNISTSTDRIVCMSVMTPPNETDDSTTSLPIQLSKAGIPVSGTQFQKINSKYGEINLITFTQGNNLVYLDLNHIFNGITLSAQDKEELGDSYTDEDTVGIVESTIAINGKDIPYYSLKDDVEPLLLVKGDDNGSLGNGFAAASGDDGNLYIAWAESDGKEQKMMVAALNVQDAEDGQEDSYKLICSTPKRMSLRNKDEETDSDADGYKPEYVMSPSISVDKDGNMMIIHNRFDLEMETEVNEDGKEAAARRNRVNNRLCVAFTKAAGSLEWLDLETGETAGEDSAITLSEEYPLAGTTFTANASICNKGLLASEDINAEARLVTLDSEGNEISSVPAKQIVKPGSLDIRLLGEVNAEFEMTQEMIDAARNNGYKYRVVLDVWEGSYMEQMITAAADVKIGSHLELETTNIDGYRTRKLVMGDDNKIAVEDIYDGNNRYIINASIHNTGNVDSAIPEVSLEMENKRIYKTGKTNAKTTGAEEASGNAVITDYDKNSSYLPVGGIIAEELQSVKLGQTANITFVSRKIPDRYYSDNAASTFIIGVTDENCYDSDNAIPDYESFTQTVGDFMEPRIKVKEKAVYGLSIKAGAEKKLTVGSAQKNVGLSDPAEWSSSNENVAAIDEDGTLHAVSKGKAVITAKTGNREANLQVNVKEQPNKPDSPQPSDSPEGGDSQKGSGLPDDDLNVKIPDADLAADLSKNTDKNTRNGVVSKPVKTGDISDVRFWIVLLCISGAAAALLKRRRKGKE